MNQSRRDLLVVVGKFVVVSAFGGLILGCDDEDTFILEAVDWKPVNVFTDLALQLSADEGLKIIDVQCHQCKTVFALTRLVVGIATTVFFECPQCGVVVNAVITVAAALVQQMRLHGFQNAVGTKTTDTQYTVRKVGPALIDGRVTQVVASSLSRDHERRFQFADGAYTTPGQNVYYTSFVCGATDQPVRHVWACNGGDAVVIGPLVNRSGYHQSRKFIPHKGLWRVACVTDSGAILDSKFLRVGVPLVKAGARKTA